jgi:DsbC/DsbD-like thiol-disulfide interchange protein
MRLLALFLFALFFPLVVFAQPSPASDHADLRFLSEYSHVKPGETTTIGLHIDLEDGWHVYWKNPGDSGIPVRFRWSDAPQVTFGDVKWPYPTTFKEEHLVTYGYKDETLLMIPVKVAADAREGTHVLETRVEFLVCKDICLPGFENHSIRLNVSKNGNPSKTSEASSFQKFRSKVPTQATLTKSTFSESGNKLTLQLEGDFSSWGNLSEALFFAGVENQIESSAPQVVSYTANTLTFELTLSRYKNEEISSLNGVVVIPAGTEKKAFEITAQSK